MLQVHVVFVAHELADLLARRKFGYALVGPGPGKDARILDRQFHFQVTQVRPAVAFDDVQVVAVRMPFAIEPDVCVLSPEETQAHIRAIPSDFMIDYIRLEDHR